MFYFYVGEPLNTSDQLTPSKRGRGYAQGRRKHNTNYVYGAKSTAAKTRYVVLKFFFFFYNYLIKSFRI